MPTSKQVKAYFDNISRDWDRIRQDYYGVSVIETALAAAGLVAGEADPVSSTALTAPPASLAELLVDVGCGTGFLTAGIAPYAHRVIGVDDSTGMLAVAAENMTKLGLAQVEFRRGSVSNLPVGEAEATAVFANMVLHHAPDPQLMLKEMARIARPSGKVVITDLETHTNDWFKVEQADVWLGFSEAELARFMEQAGLVDYQFGWVGTQ